MRLSPQATLLLILFLCVFGAAVWLITASPSQ